MKSNQKTWKAYRRADGRLGIRNKILVIYTVECSHFVADEIVRRAADGEVEVVGFAGCTDNAYAVRLLVSLIRHPNVGGVLAVGLGCEYVQAKKLAEAAVKAGKSGCWLHIQENGGTGGSIRRGLELLAGIKRELADVSMADMRFADLVIGAECGGSDYTSGLAGNVVVGRFFDYLVEAGGTAIFEEIVEAVGLKDLLVSRGADAAVWQRIAETYDKALAYCASVHQYSISPGNFAGGLSTIEEKSMGAVIKSGTKPIREVLKVGQRPKKKGLMLLDSTPDPYFMQFGITNPNDNEGLMDLISAGSHILLYVTGRGSVVGSAVSPVIKITGNSDTYRRMEDDMDFDAGRILRQAATFGELTAELADTVAKVAAGEQSKSEAWGHKEYYIPYKYQDSEERRFCRCGEDPIG